MPARIVLCLVTAASLTGCATGYGTLAGAGAGMILGTIGTVASASRGERADGIYIVQGAAAGALFGVVAAAVAAAVARGEGRREAIADSSAKSNEARLRALEERVERAPAEEHPAPQTP